MQFFQKEIQLPPHPRGFHLITNYILQAIPELKQIHTGMLQVFIKHTSASLTINENADDSVLNDFESHMNVLVPEDADYFTHTIEGPDDMTSHIKASLMGASVQIPVTNGNLNMGVWQGIYLCEHRNRPRSRTVVITAFGA
ncbi:MAG: secondary thiamine-phosphate synthase enzyme YjbQ [Flavobacteriaceae bacterium]|nr:secondary thiamine-phosphate synthase enzyme YjbQ [Flavobacteriaceae bacterium]